MKKDIFYKIEKLKKILKRMGSVLVAYSGGVDSSFLLKVAKDVLGEDLLAVTAVSPTYTQRELIIARNFTDKQKIKHLIIRTAEYRNILFRKNSPLRCYWCKRELFLKLKEIAKKYRINYVIDGANYDDLSDFRPGERAKRELGVRSPLQEAGLKKEEIRYLSKRLRLPSYNYPAQACLASRIPYGEKISIYKLRRIEKAESFLQRLGFLQVRIRAYTDLARIEVEKDKISLLIKNSSKIISFLKKLGFSYITVDLEGYRRGSMNISLKKNFYDG
ncbi:MAG: ATP-dependent sacrificial sulfur transferase LarE [Candidatus Omnitrophica bacterium]|nr:ATP-dependent sacrificial sulfur transferase LarE [Candidatus Omnitrophota bacterium]